ncbi:hypothetical protein GR160_03180 [Flavobacterium sp. Sd200]|uniref:hypothetical protein n=1 Tax=Flavobacterium sp. Sd200 TaxID=2692211 RepID=UPI001371445E|nr:hypothetical protein [Flavobacterium sp. Sd200]MXN90218.1 hypothetical protein [Flavobacterium sp. Sd200]
MKTMKEKIEAVRIEFERKKKKTTALQLIKYPKDSLGHNLGKHLLDTNYGTNVTAEKEDVYQLLIARGEVSVKEDIATQFYIFGNGSNSLRTLLAMMVGIALCPFYAAYFYKRYKEGKEALRFYDVDHFGMLHLPVERIKDTFLIR